MKNRLLRTSLTRGAHFSSKRCALLILELIKACSILIQEIVGKLKITGRSLPPHLYKCGGKSNKSPRFSPRPPNVRLCQVRHGEDAQQPSDLKYPSSSLNKGLSYSITSSCFLSDAPTPRPFQSAPPAMSPCQQLKLFAFLSSSLTIIPKSTLCNA